MIKKLVSCTIAALLCLAALAQGGLRDRYVVIVSFDGFRHDYIDNNRTPAFDKMAKNGVRAVMMPSYPASTFPNHYAMATGLVPDHNGLVNNSFWDPEHQQRYSMGSDLKSKSYFYLGEPLWNTAQRQGVIAGVTYWVGSEFNINGARPRYHLRYVNSELLSFPDRVKRTIELLQLPEEERPRLLMVYFSEPDHTGHMYGPMHRNTRKSVRRMDKILGQLRNSLAKLPIADKIDLIVVSDHGMTEFCGNCKTDAIYFHPVFPAIDNKIGSDETSAFCIQPSEITVLFQRILFVHEKRLPAKPTGGSLHPKKLYYLSEGDISNCEAGSSFCSACRQDLAAVGCLHTCTESVNLAALTFFGVISTNSCHLGKLLSFPAEIDINFKHTQHRGNSRSS